MRQATYALDQDLARRRLVYSRPSLTLPDILVIDVPPRYAAASLPLGRYYPIIVESEREHVELDGYLRAPRAGPVIPDLLDYRPSQLVTSSVTIVTYDPPQAHWPFVLLCHWPAAYTAMVQDRATFARNAYTIEMFETLEALNAASAQILTVLGAANGLEIRVLPHDTGAIGSA